VANQDWRRRYPPLSGAVIATLLAVLVLPSALNVPQSNPTQTLEFAPIPPDQDQPPPPDSGNVDRLGLGSSSTLPGDAVDGGGPGLPPRPPPIPGGVGERPVTKRCVGDPPRQTADPLAPPCVAHFDGDNGGATYQGVTGDEVQILAYADAYIHTATEHGTDDESNNWMGRCKDIAHEPPSDDETMTFRIMRRFQHYFNDRFQTYGRTVSFVVCFSPQTAANTTAETRLADAAKYYGEYRPFAVVTSGLVDGYQDTFMNYMADHGVMVFGSSQGARPAEFYRQYPGLIWTVPPTLERKTDRYIDFVCQKVVPHPVSDAGDASMNGQPRVLGLTHTSDQRWPQLLQAKDRVKAGIEACGGQFEVTVTFPRANAQFQSSYSGQYALQNMSQMQANGVTTIVWPGGYENEQTDAAAQLGYQPEWVVLGMGHHEGNNNARLQHPDVWEHAWLVTTTSRTWPRNQDPCRQAANEADPSIRNQGEVDTCVRFPYYEDLRQLFTGIQVAGPNLTPTTIDRGFHAIPAVRSTNPFVPACYYDPADYTCIKDAMVETWDPQGLPEDDSQPREPGCWRLVESGLRYPARWPDGNLDAQATPDDPCNTDTSSTPMFAPVPR